MERRGKGSGGGEEVERSGRGRARGAGIIEFRIGSIVIISQLTNKEYNNNNK